MGLLDLFSRKTAQSEDSIKRDIAEMKSSVEQLSAKVRDNDKNTQTIYEAMSEMLKEIEKNSQDIAAVSKTTIPNPKYSNSEKEILILKSKLSAMETGVFEMKKKINEIMRISRLAIQNHDEISEIKQQIYSMENDAPKKELIEKENRGGEFSAKEMGVLNALLNSEIPLTYEEIAAQVNISQITVKGYINSIKKIKPDIILENTKGRGRKAYSVKSEYRIRVLSGKR